MAAFNIAILASGSGTNAENIIDYFQDHKQIKVVLLLSNNSSAYALERARNRKIEAVAFTREQFSDPDYLLQILRQRQVTHIVLAGFLWLIPAFLIETYPDHIVNIHPALLPKHGGKGMYGMKVHEAVLKAGDKLTGITIHLVNQHYDEGRILFQTSCAIDNMTSAQSIAECVHQLEHAHYPRIIEDWILKRL